jgi:hypothetical protein
MTFEANMYADAKNRSLGEIQMMKSLDFSCSRKPEVAMD